MIPTTSTLNFATCAISAAAPAVNAAQARPIRLRPHHLLCLLTFAGEGYSRTFIENFEHIIERLQQGRRVALVAGPDDICAPLLGDGATEHCRSQSVTECDAEAKAALHAIPALAPLFAAPRDESHVPMHAGVSLDGTTIAELRRRFADGSIRGACTACRWSTLCTDIAQNNFAAAQLSDRSGGSLPPIG